MKKTSEMGVFEIDPCTFYTTHVMSLTIP